MEKEHSRFVSNESDVIEDSNATPRMYAKDGGKSFEMIRRHIAEKFGFSKRKKEAEAAAAGGQEEAEEERRKQQHQQVLDEVTIDGIIKYIKSQKCQNIVVMAGAGISTSAGIPDFRSPSTGLYQNLAKYNLPYPQAIFEISYFKSNPKPFYALAKELFPVSYKPTPAHYFVRLLHEKNLLLRHYTQNVDGLEKLAGIPSEKIVEAHGTFYTSHCMACNREYSLEWMKDKILGDEIPRCVTCKGLVKPDIVLFGENLPPRFFNLAKKDFAKADLLIVMGSSLLVQPFASLVDRVRPTCPRLLLNKEKSGQRDRILSLFGMSGGGLDFDSNKNARDVAFLGDCDDLCRQMVDMLSWNAEYEELIKSYT